MEKDQVKEPIIQNMQVDTQVTDLPLDEEKIEGQPLTNGHSVQEDKWKETEGSEVQTSQLDIEVAVTQEKGDEVVENKTPEQAQVQAEKADQLAVLEALPSHTKKVADPSASDIIDLTLTDDPSKDKSLDQSLIATTKKMLEVLDSETDKEKQSEEAAPQSPK